MVNRFVFNCRHFLPIEILTCVALSSSPMNHHGSKLFLGNEVGEIFVKIREIISPESYVIYPQNGGFLVREIPLCQGLATSFFPQQIFHQTLHQGIDHQIKTPFGTRKLVYSDFTASGRALGWVEAWCPLVRFFV